MHPETVRRQVLQLVEAGINDCAVSRRTGVPRSTVREMRHRATAPDGPVNGRAGERCWRCWGRSRKMRFGERDYAELLGVYLGDGHIVGAGRSDRLRVFLDGRYPGIIADIEALVRRGFPENAVGRLSFYDGRMAVISVYSRHLRCLLPQHGAGLKHQREIALEDWQERIVAAQPWPLIRGLIRTDGCSFVNRTGRYEYLSYAFSNRSQAITDLLCDALERVGVDYRRNYTAGRKLHTLRVNRRANVAMMVDRIGIKA
jgi:hypothetical protein